MENTFATENESTGTKQPAPELRSLEKLNGTWKITGTNFSSAPEGDTAVTGTVTNKWLPGHFFLTTEWAYQFGKDEHVGSGAIGFSEELNSLFVRNYDNMGYERLYVIDIYKNTWNYKGEYERATLVFNDTENAYEENWEIKLEEEWKPLCTRKGSKQ